MLAEKEAAQEQQSPTYEELLEMMHAPMIVARFRKWRLAGKPVRA